MNRRRVLGGALCALVTGGCEATGRPHGLPAAARYVDGVEVWDLRERPIGAAVGLGQGGTAVVAARAAREDSVLLEGVALGLPLRCIAFSAIGSADGGPAGVLLRPRPCRWRRR